MKRRGFTLIELTAVMGVVFTLTLTTLIIGRKVQREAQEEQFFATLVHYWRTAVIRVRREQKATAVIIYYPSPQPYIEIYDTTSTASQIIALPTGMKRIVSEKVAEPAGERMVRYTKAAFFHDPLQWVFERADKRQTVFTFQLGFGLLYRKSG